MALFDKIFDNLTAVIGVSLLISLFFLLIKKYKEYKIEKSDVVEKFYFKAFNFKKIKTGDTFVYYAECTYDDFLSYYMTEEQYVLKLQEFKTLK